MQALISKKCKNKKHPGRNGSVSAGMRDTIIIGNAIISCGSDDALRLIPISKLSLEGCLEFLAQDELLEVTPENLRIRKQILNHEQRMKAKSKLK